MNADARKIVPDELSVVEHALEDVYACPGLPALVTNN